MMSTNRTEPSQDQSNQHRPARQAGATQRSGRSKRRLRAREVEARLQGEATIFLRRWGRTDWRDLVDRVRPIEDQRLHQLVLAVAAIEDDAFYMQTKLRHAGVLRSPAVQQFNAVWLSEESDHGRAFEALARRLGANQSNTGLGHDTLARDRRAILALAVMRAARLHRIGMLGGYLIRGALVEHVAIIAYGRLRNALREVGEDAGAEIVRQILRQEGRHLRFFTQGAIATLSADPTAAKLIRKTVDATWRPPGVDLYGHRRWAELFEPVLTDSVAVTELLAVDSKLNRIPGFEDATIVTDYLDKLSPASATG